MTQQLPNHSKPPKLGQDMVQNEDILCTKSQDFGAENDAVCAMLEAEGIPCWEGYAAMHHYDLFQPQLSKLAVPSAFPERFQFDQMQLPEAERACEHEAVWLDESIFRAGKQGVDDTVAALKKIQAALTDETVRNQVQAALAGQAE